MEKVLLIDNDQPNVDMMAQWLSDEGYKLNKLYSHKGLLGKIYAFNPSIIVMGITLHGTDGRHFCSLLKTIDRTRHIKIIIMSAVLNYYSVDDYEWCADHFLYEPNTKEKLLNALKGVMQKQANSYH
ncbi:MAG: response regulator [Pedobacter sp.]|nr:MAG: response regulator [Pedobacter sp.]